MGLFGIYPSSGTPATGVVTFATSFPVSAAPTATQAIPIPAGTIVQTPGGALFSTLLAATLASGTASVNVGVAANAIGTAGNVPALAISGPPLTNVGWPLFVENAAPTGGGANAGTPSQALALFAATVAKLGRASPIAVANAPVGITVSGTGRRSSTRGRGSPGSPPERAPARERPATRSSSITARGARRMI